MTSELSDEAFIAALEDCSLAPKEFGHRGHVRAGFLYLQRHGFIGGLGSFRAALRRYAAHLGAPEKYNETITVAYLALIHERMAEDETLDWRAYADAYPELFEPGLLLRYYRPETLGSERARRIFLLGEASAA